MSDSLSASRTEISLPQALMVGVWLGVVTGIAELLGLGVIKFGSLAQPDGPLRGLSARHPFLWVSEHILWMAPTASALLFLLVTGAILAAGRVLPSLRTRRVVLAVLLALSVANLLTVYPRLHPLAVILLAIGVGVQGSRWLSARWGKFDRIVHRSTVWLAGSVMVIAMTMTAGARLLEARRIARLPLPVRTANVLLVILDTVRASNLSVYGYDRPTTPNLAEFASKGVVFERAIATAPWTLPSHVSMFTGRWPYQSTGDWREAYGGEHVTLAERLAGDGYVTAGFVANLAYCGYETGLDDGFIRYVDYRISPAEFLLSTALTRQLANSPIIRRAVGFYDVVGRKSAEDVNGEFVRWLDGNGNADRPFFAFLNYFDAHEPYLPPDPYLEQFGSSASRRHERNVHQMRISRRLDREQMPPEELQAELDAYDGAIAYLDAQLGQLFEALEARGIMENTLVVVVGDHGEQFGEHGMHAHGNSLFTPVIQVPLIMAFGDKLPAGRRVAPAVSIREIPATIMSLLGVNARLFPTPPASRFWAPVADPGQLAPTPLLAEFTTPQGNAAWKSLVIGQYHYMWGEDGFEQVYDLAADPNETAPINREALESGLLARLRAAMRPHVRGDEELWNRLPQTATRPADGGAR